MLARKCDRCGAFYDSYNIKNNGEKPNAYMLLNLDDKGLYFSHDCKDLCPMCMDAFLNFMHERKEE